MVTLTLTLTLISCDTSYPPLTYEAAGERNKNEEQYGKLVITPTFDLNALFYTSAIQSAVSKGTGAFDKKDDEALFYKKFQDADFCLLGYRKTYTQSEGSLSSQPDFNAIYEESGDHKDCLMGSTTSHAGEPAHADSRGVLTPHDEDGKQRTYYWSESYPQIGYDFFTYYIDDAQGTPVSSSDKITIPLTIDGTQDVMYGYSQTLTKEYLQEYGLNDASQEVIDNILYYGDGSYSTYSAFYGVQPKLNIKHAMSKLVFYTTLAGRDNIDMSITGIQLDMKTHGSLTVASRNVNEVGYVTTGDDEKVSLHRCPYVDDDGNIKMGDPIDTDHPLTVENVIADATTKGAKIGEMLVPAGVTEYIMHLQCKEMIVTNKNTGEKHTVLSDLTSSLDVDPRINPECKFQAGYEYPVVLSVYGSSEIKVYVGSPTWQNGGTSDVNIGD